MFCNVHGSTHSVVEIHSGICKGLITFLEGKWLSEVLLSILGL